MLAYARLHPGKGFDPIRAALYYSQRLAVSPSVREMAARSIGVAINFAHPFGNRPPITDSDKAGIDLLVRDGVAPLGSLLTVSEADRLVADLAAKPVVTPSGNMCALADIPAGTAQVSYPLRTILECAAVSPLANNPHILAIARHYLGCTPTISSIGIRWSFCGGQAAATQTFHRDVDDWRFLKLFVYLSDVDDASGPHEYVKGSHRIRGTLRGNSYSDSDIESRFGAGGVDRVTGPRGTAFFADTYGIHRGRPPQKKPRLMLQVQYSVLPVYAFAYEPLEIPSTLPVDSYINRLLLKPGKH
jgi:hypothetical protein